ncbi:hypothetical protein CPB85DRAFT_1414242 [Mucidula mucida]|nr:hypothetical protein CPB85DRAFT_1414242 [Mucidula mucida]
MSDTGMPVDLVKTTGPLLLGYIINCGLYGALCVQVYLYYISFPNDHTRSKAVVYSLFVIETAQVVMNISDVFDLFAVGYGDLDTLDKIHLSWLAVPILTGLGAFIVQCFYGYRIYLLTERSWIPSVIALLSVTQFTAAFVGGIQVYLKGRFSLIESTRTASTIWLAGSAACDVVIAGTMTHHLVSADTGFKSTHLILTKIIRLVVETGSVTASVAVLDLILFLTFPDATYHTVPAQSLAKLYSNAVLVLFNSRIKIRGGREEAKDSHESDIELPYSTTSTGFQFGGPLKFNPRSVSQRESRPNNVDVSSWEDDIQTTMHNMVR